MGTSARCSITGAPPSAGSTTAPTASMGTCAAASASRTGARQLARAGRPRQRHERGREEREPRLHRAPPSWSAIAVAASTRRANSASPTT